MRFPNLPCCPVPILRVTHSTMGRLLLMLVFLTDSPLRLAWGLMIRKPFLGSSGRVARAFAKDKYTPLKRQFRMTASFIGLVTSGPNLGYPLSAFHTTASPKCLYTPTSLHKRQLLLPPTRGNPFCTSALPIRSDLQPTTPAPRG